MDSVTNEGRHQTEDDADPPGASVVLRGRPMLVLIGLWLVAQIVLLATGHPLPALIAAGSAVFVLLLVWVTVRLTAPAPTPPWHRPPAPPATRRRLWAQLAVLIVIVLVALHLVLAIFGLVPAGWRDIPGVSAALRRVSAALLSVGFPGYADPIFVILYFLLPLLLLLALGARPAEVGLGRGHRSWRVAAVWSAIPLAMVVVNLATGAMTPGRLLTRAVQTTLNASFEEFLFRGALLTRLARLWGDGWGITLSCVVFGLLHTGTNAQDYAPGDIVVGLAAGIAQQGVLGVSFAVMLLRTRSLLAGWVTHICVNTGLG